MHQAPWNFRGHLLILKTWSPGSTLQEVSLKNSTFNVQIHGLPLDHMTVKNAINLGNALGKLIHVEEDPTFGVAWRKFIRLKVEIDVTYPLKQGFMMPRWGNTETWIALKYERLSDFCHACGRLGHSPIFCSFQVHPPTKLAFGPWLRAEYIGLDPFQNFCQTAGHMGM